LNQPDVPPSQPDHVTGRDGWSSSAIDGLDPHSTQSTGWRWHADVGRCWSRREVTQNVASDEPLTWGVLANVSRDLFLRQYTDTNSDTSPCDIEGNEFCVA
jgi:hypothetical protein